MTTLNDDIMGIFTLDNRIDAWVRPYDVTIFGSKITVKLNIYCDLAEIETDPYESNQRDLFIEFEKNQNRYIHEIEQSIFNYYTDIMDDTRSDLEQYADELMPLVSKINDLQKIVKFETIMIEPIYKPEERQIGFLFDCPWDDHGIGVKMVNGKVVEVGQQDIIL